MSTPFIGASGHFPRILTLGGKPGKVGGENGCKAVESDFCLGWRGVAASSDYIPRMTSPI